MANETWVDITFPFLSVQRLLGSSSFSSLFLLHHSRDHKRIQERERAWGARPQNKDYRLQSILSAQATRSVEFICDLNTLSAELLCLVGDGDEQEKQATGEVAWWSLGRQPLSP